MPLRRQINAAIEMSSSRGLPDTLERAKNFLYARHLNWRRSSQFRRLGLKAPVVRSILGSKMLLDPAQRGLERDLLLDGIREPIATGHIMGILKADDVVLEVGANLGYYALLEARFCKQVYAVEPHPENFRRLNENILLNSYTNIKTHNAAFGSASGEIPMACSELSNWHSCHNVDMSNHHTIKVPCVTVDEFVDKNETPSFVKMDVEGYELEVLRGAKKTLGAINHLFIEVHGDILAGKEVKEVINLILQSGLKPSLVAQYDRPGLARVYPPAHIENILCGDRGTYELFFSR